LTHRGPAPHDEESVKQTIGSRARPARTPAGVRERLLGFTLIELIVVMGLMAMLFGLGVGMISSLNLGRRAAVGTVQNVLRSAHNSALARGASARVRIDPASGTIRAEGMKVIGTWHFESERMDGAQGLDGTLAGPRIVEEGYLGRAISFNGAPSGSIAEVPVQQDPGFDLASGFTIDCAVRLEDRAGSSVIDVGGAAGIEIDGQRGVRAWLKPQVIDSTGAPAPGGTVAADSPDGSLLVGVWTRVRAEYDRRLLRLFLDGVEVARAEESSPVWRVQSSLVLGDRRNGFAGSLDCLVISAVTESEEVRLPQGVAFASDAPKVIAFDPSGHLDREVHDKPIAFFVEFEDGTKTRVRVGMYGTVE
jgi:concanavalin A-like lectin/glucanase superfamily protein